MSVCTEVDEYLLDNTNGLVADSLRATLRYILKLEPQPRVEYSSSKQRKNNS